jgi:hypothetical protein
MGVELVALAVRKVSSWMVAQKVLGRRCCWSEMANRRTDRGWNAALSPFDVGVRGGETAACSCQACMTVLRCRVIPLAGGAAARKSGGTQNFGS